MSERAEGAGPLDEVDRRILQILERDAQTDPRQIAIMLEITPEDVAARIANAEAVGAIVRRKVVVNWEQAGEPFVLALIEVKVTPQRETGFDAIAERIYRYPEARSVYLVSGEHDLRVLVQGGTMKEVAFFVAKKLATIDRVQSTATYFLLNDGQDFLGSHTTPAEWWSGWEVNLGEATGPREVLGTLYRRHFSGGVVYTVAPGGSTPASDQTGPHVLKQIRHNDIWMLKQLQCAVRPEP